MGSERLQGYVSVAATAGFEALGCLSAGLVESRAARCQSLTTYAVMLSNDTKVR